MIVNVLEIKCLRSLLRLSRMDDVNHVRNEEMKSLNMLGMKR